MEVILYSPVRTRQSARSRRAGICEETRRVEQAVAGRVLKRGVKRRLIKYRVLIIILVGIWEVRVPYPEVESQAAGHLEIILGIEFKVLPTPLLFEDDVLFAPTDSRVLQNPISRAVVRSKVR